MKISFQIYLVFLVVAGPVFAGRLDGLELQLKKTTAIIPYNEKVVIYPLNGGEINTGFLVKVSDMKIFLKDIQTGELVTTSKNQVEQIRAIAVTRPGSNFLYGLKLGSSFGYCYALFETARQYLLLTREPATIVFGMGFYAPIAAAVGGLSFGLVNMLNKIHQVSQTDVFLIGNNNWEFVAPRKQRVGLFRKMSILLPKLK